MYCNQCGKEIESGDLCYECAQAVERQSSEEISTVPAETESVAPAYTYTESDSAVYAYSDHTSLPDPQNRMFGFGKALASTILAWVGFIFAYAGLIAGIVEPSAGLVLVFLALPLIIVPFVLGLSSIRLFKARSRTCAKPIPTLVLGIVGVSTAGLTAFIDFCALIASVAMMYA